MALSTPAPSSSFLDTDHYTRDSQPTPFDPPLDLRSTSRKRPRKTNRKPPRSESEKLQATIKALEETAGLNLLDVLRGIAHRKSEDGYTRHWRLFRKFAYNEMPQGTSSLPGIEVDDWDTLLAAGGYKRVQQKLRKELITLTNDTRCGRFQYPDIQHFGYIDELAALQGVITTKAPRLIELLSTIARQYHIPAENPVEPGHRQVFWVLQMLFAIQRSKSSGFAKTLGIYLIDSGAKKRVVDLFSTLGVCCSYTTVQNVLKGLVTRAERQVRALSTLTDIVKAYDNFEFSEHRSAERVGNRKVFRSITTALMFRGRMIPVDGLRQGMWRPQSDLTIKSIIPNPSPIENHRFQQIRLALWHVALQRAFPRAYEGEGGLNIRLGSTFAIPAVRLINASKTKSFPLSPVFCDESIVEGNISIHEDIEERQLGGDMEASIWADILKPYFGDLKTINRLLAVQSIRRSAERPFDSRRWIIPGLGLWHLRFNLLRLIHKIHWGGSSPEDTSTLQFAADAWDRSNVHTPNDFAKLEALIKHSYQARIASLILFLGNEKARKGQNQATRWLRRVRRHQYKTLLVSLFQLVYPPSLKDKDETPPLDEVLENHLRFICQGRPSAHLHICTSAHRMIA